MKRKFKSLLAVILSLFMLAGLTVCKSGDIGSTVSPASGQAALTAQPGAEPIIVTIAGTEKNPYAGFPEGIDDENNPWREAYRNELGIEIKYKWVVAGDKFTDKLNTQIAAGDVPDIIYSLGRAQFDRLVQLGLAAPLDDLIDKYATDLTKRILNSDGGYSVLKSRGEDGKLYALPHVYGYEDNVAEMWIRSDWLRNVSLPAPKTMDDLYNVLQAFVENDPDNNGVKDTLGLITTSSLWEANSIFNAYGAQPFWSWYKDADGTLKYSTVYKPESMKKALAFMNRLYENGYMDQEFGVANWDKVLETIVSGKAGLVFLPRWATSVVLNDNVQRDDRAEWDAFPIPTGLDGGEPAAPFAYYGAAAYNVISAKSAHPEAGIKMLNLYVDKVFGPNAQQTREKFITNKDGYNMKRFAILGTDWVNDDKYRHVSTAVESANPSALTADERITYDAIMAYMNGNRENWLDYKNYGPDNVTVTVIEYYKNTVIPLFSRYYGITTESVQQYQGDLDAKWLSLCIQIIMGQKPVSAYDDFVVDWYQLGGDKMTNETNDYARAHPDTVK